MQLPQNVVAMLGRGGQVVTANARAARDLRRLYGEQQMRASGTRAWASPAILELHGWLENEWEKLLLSGSEQRLLLTPLQESAVWSELVRPLVEQRSLISPDDVARLAQRTYARLAAYGGTGRLANRDIDWGAEHDAGYALGELREPELFQRWAREFERTCERRGWVSAPMLPWVLAEAYSSRKISAVGEMLWNGFDRYTPAGNELRRALGGAGCVLHAFAWDVTAKPRRTTAQTVDEEMEACAWWARSYLERHPGARIGVLLQDVEPVRAQVDRVFRRVLMPRSEGLLATPQKPLYEFTLGLPLGAVPVVRAALLLLQWLTRPLEQEEISWLMTSGFLGDGDETVPLAAADARLRQEELLAPEQALDDFLRRMARASTRQAVVRWMLRLRRAKELLNSARSRSRSCRQWAALTEEVLATAGWPGSRFADSVGYQIRKRWQRVMEEVAALDFADERLSFARFVDVLAAHARGSIFSAESEEAPVSISGVFESAGRAFDAIWVMQTTDETWPARSAASPMLPGWLQAELGMPRGDAAEDRVLSADVVARLRASTTELTFSYAREGPAGAQRPAAMLAAIEEEWVELPPPVLRALLTEEFEDDSAVAWPGGDRIAGGQSVLKMQAACPFQAFAGRRLGGKEQRDSSHGLDAAQRGSLLHAVLQTLWVDPLLCNSDGLVRAIASGEIAECVQKHVALALAEYRVEAGSWELEYLALEEQRLYQVMMEWLSYEAKRLPFAVERVEAAEEIEIAGLRLNVRMDRVDRLEHGRILIDYKTGDVKANKWFGDRPDEPQLPLYAIAGKVEDVRDVYFAKLRPGTKPGGGAGKLELLGALTGDDSALFLGPGGQPARDGETFAQMLDGWRETLSALSREFQAGVATVTPKEYPKTCAFCAFGGLCRVAEVQAAATADAPAGDEEA